MARLDELQFFVAVAQTGSFTAAATRLGAPNSTVTRAVSRLEKHLGVRLFTRTTRRVTLTEPGELFLQHCLQALEEIEQGELEVSAFRGDPRGRLRIATPVFFARMFLTPLLPEFMRRHPGVRLHLHMREFDSPLPITGFDILIQTGPVADSAMFIKHLGEARMGIYASPAYLESAGSPESPQKLSEHTCVTLGEYGEGAIWRMSRRRESRQVRLDPHISAGNAMLHQTLARDGAGIVCIPCTLAAPDEQTGNLVRILKDWEPEPLTVYALYPSRLDMSPKVRAFLQYLSDHLSIE